MTVRGATSGDYGGFLRTLEFETNRGAKCRIGKYAPDAFEVSHEGFHLAYLSGTFGRWGVIKTIKSVMLHWEGVNSTTTTTPASTTSPSVISSCPTSRPEFEVSS